jgi:hypothetical protein
MEKGKVKTIRKQKDVTASTKKVASIEVQKNNAQSKFSKG